VEWAAFLRGWQQGHENEATIIPGIKEVDRSFDKVIVVIIDDHTGLTGRSGKYLGLRDNQLAKYVYRRLFTEPQSFSRVVYGFSDWPDRFVMDQQLRADSSLVAGMSIEYGCFPVSLESFGRL
jgi:hypothetical protein